nr:MAG TPA: hypothetical protein [Caudoviricetes sp.]
MYTPYVYRYNTNYINIRFFKNLCNDDTLTWKILCDDKNKTVLKTRKENISITLEYDFCYYDKKYQKLKTCTVYTKRKNRKNQVVVTLDNKSDLLNSLIIQLFNKITKTKISTRKNNYSNVETINKLYKDKQCIKLKKSTFSRLLNKINNDFKYNHITINKYGLTSYELSYHMFPNSVAIYCPFDPIWKVNIDTTTNTYNFYFYYHQIDEIDSVYTETKINITDDPKGMLYKTLLTKYRETLISTLSQIKLDKLQKQQMNEESSWNSITEWLMNIFIK